MNCFRTILQAIVACIEERKRMANSLDNLTASVTRLTASVDNAVTVLGTPHPTDAQVQAAAEAINSQADRLDLAANPPPPTKP